jgi:NitT/TauT family transport system substrate-binding protein
MTRRGALFALLLAALGLGAAPGPIGAEERERIVVSVPGPRNLSYLPIDLIPRLGFDADEGVDLQLIHTGGGAVALANLMNRNADFAVAGAPAAMSLRANGGDVVLLAAVNDAPLFVLMVRAGLRDEVRRIGDLRGRVIGVNTSTRSSKTTSQQLAELLLASDGVAPDQVRIVPAGQSWVEQSSLLLSGTADAVMGDEPFASRLEAAGQAFFLANLADPALQQAIPGSNFLHAALETRGELIAKSPERVARMVRMLRRTLEWIAAHTPEAVLERLGVTDEEERASLLLALRKYPAAFSRDGAFSTPQLAETERFFRSTNPDNAGARALRLDSMVNDRWAGRRP